VEEKEKDIRLLLIRERKNSERIDIRTRSRLLSILFNCYVQFTNTKPPVAPAVFSVCA